jgi:hypothetical protein
MKLNRHEQALIRKGEVEAAASSLMGRTKISEVEAADLIKEYWDDFWNNNRGTIKFVAKFLMEN